MYNIFQLTTEIAYQDFEGKRNGKKQQLTFLVGLRIYIYTCRRKIWQVRL